jgi:hypothetical protein
MSLRGAQPKGTPQLEKFIRLVARFFPPIRTLHPLPSPLRRQNPREEPGALAPHAGICTGAGSSPRPATAATGSSSARARSFQT